MRGLSFPSLCSCQTTSSTWQTTSSTWRISHRCFAHLTFRPYRKFCHWTSERLTALCTMREAPWNPPVLFCCDVRQFQRGLQLRPHDAVLPSLAVLHVIIKEIQHGSFFGTFTFVAEIWKQIILLVNRVVSTARAAVPDLLYLIWSGNFLI